MNSFAGVCDPLGNRVSYSEVVEALLCCEGGSVDVVLDDGGSSFSSPQQSVQITLCWLIVMAFVFFVPKLPIESTSMER